MKNLTHNNLHFTFVTVARGKIKICGGKLHTSNLNNQKKYNL